MQQQCMQKLSRLEVFLIYLEVFLKKWDSLIQGLCVKLKDPEKGAAPIARLLDKFRFQIYWSKDSYPLRIRGVNQRHPQ